MRTRPAIKPSTPQIWVPPPHPPPACTSRRRSSANSKPAASRSKPSPCTSDSEPSNPSALSVIEDIRLHTEHYTLPRATSQRPFNKPCRKAARIIAAGTTTTRTLEHCAAISNLEPHSGSTSIFISPGHRFRIISGLLTNFHLPQSTLLMLVSAFLAPSGDTDLGRQHALAAYAHAIAQRYRFFSYGDCMLIL